MFIDYLPLLLINMLAGLVLLACYVNGFLNSKSDKGWAAAFLAVGAVAFICGLHMTLTWPLPGSYNIAFGEPSVFLGMLFLAAGFSVARGYSLLPLSIYALFAGIAAVVVGFRIINLNMTNAPLVSGMGFICTGSIGPFLLLVLIFPKSIWLKIIISALLAAAILIWAYAGYFAYWAHLNNFTQWKPVIMR